MAGKIGNITGMIFVKACFIGLLFVLDVQSGFGADIYVDDDACPGVGTGTQADPYCSLQTGINAAVYGDNVLVLPGDYVHIIMKSGVDVLDADNTDGVKPRILSDVDKPIVQFLEGVQDCTLDGFVIDDSDTISAHAMIVMVGYNDKYASDPLHNKNLVIQNCDLLGAGTMLESTTTAGISIHATLQNVFIKNNTIRNVYGTAIVVGKHAQSPWPLKYCSLTIEGNTIENNAWGGIYLRSMPDMWNKIIIKDNIIRTNRSLMPNGSPQGHIGIGLVNIHRGYDKILGIPREDATTIENCGEISANSCGATIENNTIVDHNLTGLLIEKTWSIPPHIIGNRIIGNSLTGMNIVDYSKVTVVDNQIYENFRSGIAFNATYRDVDPLSESVSILNNEIDHNEFSGVAVLDDITGLLTIKGNNLHHNSKAGLAFFNAAASIIIEDNDIHDNETAGIYTGKWKGDPATDNHPGADVKFELANGPVNLTIRRNKVYDNAAGMRLDHASGTITNNLVYDNAESGIRFSGNNVGGFEPFGASWGVTVVKNNTVSHNIDGAGIVYDNINYVPRTDDGSDLNEDGYRDFTDIPRLYRVDGLSPLPIIMKNNISDWNTKLGIRDSSCDTNIRDYNLVYYNNGVGPWATSYERFQFGSCTKNEFEIIEDDPLYVDQVNGDYQLQATSPAVGSGEDGNDMGAYGGSDPITW